MESAKINPHPLDADFMCKIRLMRTRICCTTKISTGYYSYFDSTLLLKIPKVGHVTPT